MNMLLTRSPITEHFHRHAHSYVRMQSYNMSEYVAFFLRVDIMNVDESEIVAWHSMQSYCA